MKKKTKQYDNLVYVVQDYQQQLGGIYTTLAKAAEEFERVVVEGLSADEIETLIEEYGENYHDELEYPPNVLVYQLDNSFVWSYDSLAEIKQALLNGENYD